MGRGDYFTHTLAMQMDCDKKLYYYLNSEPQAFSPILNIGVKLHSLCEAHLKDEDYEIPDLPSVRRTFAKMIPVLDAMKDDVDEIELTVDREEDGFVATGRLDVLLEGGIAVDYKFPLRPWTAEKFAHYAQTQGYPYLWMLEDYLGEPPKMMRYIVAPMEERARVETFDLPYDADAIKQTLNILKGMMARVEANRNFNVWPPTKSKFTCKYCNYRHVCPEALWKDEDKKKPSPLGDVTI